MKTALVTGASTGIGRAIAMELSKNGYRILLVARNHTKLEKVMKEIEANGGTAEYYTVDLNDHFNIKSLISEITDNFNAGIYENIDAIINVAGVWHGENSVYADIDFESFDTNVILETYNVGLTAPTLIIQGLLPKMKSGSNIINITGTFEKGGKGWLPYYVSKRALEDLTIGLADELKDKNIHVNAISPSDTNTDAYRKYFPQYIDEAIEPEKIATFVLELIQKNVTGKVYVMKKDKVPYEGFHI